MWERAAAIIFVFVFPLTSLLIPKLKFDRTTSNKYKYYAAFMSQTLFVGFLLGFWVHFIPCFWLACDLGPNDNGTFRGILWLTVWFICTILVSIYLYRYEKHTFLKYSTVVVAP